MMKTATPKRIAAVVVACVLFGYSSSAQTRSPEAELKAAQHREQVEGDLKGAIEQYKRLIDRRGVARPITAEALLGLAQSYEKLGSAEARAVYEQIVRDYVDQPAIASLARERHNQLGATASGSLVARRVVRLPDAIAVLSLLADGRIGGTDWSTGDVVIVDPAKGTTTSVVRGDINKTRGPWGEDPLMSPDRRQLVYQWFGSDPREQSGVLKIVGLEGDSKPRTIEVRAPTAIGNIVPLAWSKDAASLLVTYEKAAPEGRNRGRGDFELGWVNVDGGSFRSLKSFEWWRNPGRNSIGTVSLSPDGAWIAYAVADGEAAPDKSIFIMRSDGSNQRRVISGGVNEQPIWTPDGAHLVFVSTRSGDPALWALPLNAGTAGAPSLIKTGIGRIHLHGFTQSGTLVYSEDSATDRLLIAELEPAKTPGAAGTLRTIETLSGLVPSWSMDGRALAYKRRTTNPARPVELVVRPSDTGELRTYVPRSGGIGLGKPTWYPDGTVQAVTRSGIRLKLGPTLEETTTPALPMGQVATDGRTLYVGVTQSLYGTTGSPDETPIIVESLDTSNGATKGTLSLPPTWQLARVSPDGQTLALIKSGNEGLMVGLIGIDGKGFRQLPSDFPQARASIGWTRDGAALLIGVSTGPDTFAIQRVPVAGGAPVTLAANIKGLRTFDVSPDERRIAYSTDPGTTDVWTLDLKGVLK